MDTEKTIGENLRKARKKQKLTQHEVAALVEMDSNYYSKIERGKGNLSLKLLHKIVVVLKVKSSDILPF